jgi:hypothetical protein
MKNTLKLAQLLSLLEQYQKEKQAYVELATQLATSNCTFEISMQIHNLDKHEEIKAADKIKSIDGGLESLYMMQGLGNFLSGMPSPLQPPTEKKDTCRLQILDKLNTSTALRVVNAIIADKQQHIVEVKRDIDLLVWPQLQELSENPIHSLHNQTA